MIRKRIKMIKHRKPERDFKSELQCLELLRCLRHPNIIELLSSYEQHGDYYLLFPELSMDLCTFLTLDARFGNFQNSLTFFKALSGLASAVETVHSLSVEIDELIISRIGYHHDIRPKNVLVTHDTFVLTDFGLMRFKMPEDSSQSQWVSTIGDYIAPECMDNDYNRLTVGRSIDIWALGCLVADVSTYMESGKDALQEFREKRRETATQQRIKNYRFFEADSLRESVIAWLDSMNSGRVEPGITCLRDIVALTLQIDPTARPKASEVSRRLSYVNTKMMYRNIVKYLDDKVSEFGDTDLISPHAHLDFFFEIEKIKAWGYVLGMEDDRTQQELFLTKPRITSELSRILEDFEDRLAISALEMPILAIVADLAKLLWENVPAVYQTRMCQAWRQSSLNTDDVPKLAMIEESSRTLPTPFSDIGKIAALKRLDLRFWDEGQKANSDQQDLLIESWRIEQERQLGETHGLGWLERDNDVANRDRGIKRNKVFIEWVLYSPSWDAQTEEEKIVKILGLAETLHQPKPDNFHVLDCVGVVPPGKELNHPGFGLVYNYPAFARSNDCDVVTLAGLLRRKHFVSLEFKFSIALRICSSIYHLHSSGFIHKNLCANNLVFFLDQSHSRDSLPKESLEPYLVGFHHSRPICQAFHSDIDAYSSELFEYRHPDYIPGKTRFEMAYDYYSVGIALLEIGFWETISAFRIRHRDIKDLGFRQVLIERYTPQLDKKMGSLYMNIVSTCLRSNFGQGPDRQIDSDVSDTFYWSVVAPLSEIKIA